MDPVPGTHVLAAPAPDRAHPAASPTPRLASSLAATEPGRYLAFLPFEHLELDLDDPEQRDFGDFELLELLGQGGMGVVYRAHQRSLDREVALKLLTAGPWATPDFVMRFQREARAAARLHHPNILPVFEIGQHFELNFFTMALVRGESLAERVEREGRLDPRVAARVIQTISEALDYAHRFGILHLDLKPANVLVDEHGEPQVADFGLARRLDEALVIDPAHTAGTPSYMAPEQASAGSPQMGVATDVYGLGAIFYELLCGQPPHLGATARETLGRVVGAIVEPPSRHVGKGAGVPIDLDAICLKCLEKDPRNRYRSALDLAADLGRFLEGRPVSVRPLKSGEQLARWARREPRVAWASGFAVFALVAGLVATSVQWRRAEAGAAELRATLWQSRLDDAARIFAEGGMLGALSGLAANLVEQEAAGETAKVRLSRQRIGSILGHAPALVDAIATGRSVQQLLLDRGGEWVAMTDARGQIADLYDIASGERRWRTRISDGRTNFELSAASDGRHLVADAANYNFAPFRGMQSVLIDLATGRRIEPPADRFPNVYGIHYSPDARTALLVDLPADRGTPTGRLVQVAGWKPIGPERTLPGIALLAPGGSHFAYRESLRDDGEPDAVQVFDARTMQLRWTYQPASGGALSAWRYAPDGKRLAAGFEDGKVVLFDAATGRPQFLRTQAGSAIHDVHFSDDGRWVAAAKRSGEAEVWDADTAEPVAPAMQSWRGDSSGSAVVRIDAKGQRVLLAGTTGARLFRLPGLRDQPSLIAELPGYPRYIQPIANDFAFDQGLWASGAIDGEVRLWRERPIRSLPLSATPFDMPGVTDLQTSNTTVDVQGRSVQLRRFDGTPVGPRLEFAQAVGYASTVGDGSALIVIVGAELHLVDGSTGEETWPPHALPGTPGIVLPAPDGRHVVVCWADRRSDRTGLVVRSINLESGLTSGEARLDHPLWMLQMGDDSRTLIATRLGQLTVLEADTLKRRWGPRSFNASAEPAPIRAAGMDRDGRLLWISTGNGGHDGYRMHALDAATGSERQVWQMDMWASAIRVFERGEAAVGIIPNRDELRIWRIGEGARGIPVPALEGNGYFSLALSEDESRLVVSLPRGLQWFALPSGEWLSPPLLAPDPTALPTHLWLNAEGSTALMHDRKRRVWRYDIATDPRPAGQLQKLTRLLAPTAYDRPKAHALPQEKSIRAALRRADSGRVKSKLAPAGDTHGSRRMPSAMDPFATERLVDLQPRCNLPLDQSAQTLQSGLALERVFSRGRHRLAGNAFQIECAVFARYAPDAADAVAAGARIQGIAIGMPRIGAVDLLVMAPSSLATRSSDIYAIVELRYRDGGTHRYPLRIGRDLDRWYSTDSENRMPSMRVAHVVQGVYLSEFGNPLLASSATAFAVRLENPHPEREVESLALESTRTPSSAPLLLAATLEPVAKIARKLAAR